MRDQPILAALILTTALVVVGSALYLLSKPKKVLPTPLVSLPPLEKQGKTLPRAEMAEMPTEAPSLSPSPTLERALELSQKESALGTSEFKKGSYLVAVEHFSRAVELCPKPSEEDNLKVMYNNRAAAYEKLQEWGKVLEDSTAALGLDGKYKRALLRRAGAYEALGDLESALGDLLVLRYCEGEDGIKKIEAALDRVRSALGKKQALEVWATRFERKSTSKPEIPLFHCRQYYYSFIRDASAMRSPPPALAIKSELSQLQVNAKDYSDRCLKIANMFKARQEYLEAFDYYEKVVGTAGATNSAMALAYSEIGSMYHLSGDVKTAREKIQLSLKAEETSSGWIKMAALSVDDGDLEKAKEYSTKAEKCVKPGLESNFEMSDVQFHQSSIACLCGDLVQAKKLLEACISRVPDFGIAHMQAGVVLFRLGMAEDAVQALERACLLTPELAEVHNFKGEVLMSLGRTEEAVAKFIEASIADEHCALPLLNRGVLFMQEDRETGAQPSDEDMKQALVYFNQAIEIDPACEIGYIHRASYFFHLGNFEKSLENYDLAITHAKSVPDLIEYCSLRAYCLAEMKAIERLGLRVGGE